MAYCTNCGILQYNEAKFCHNCGNKNDQHPTTLDTETPIPNQIFTSQVEIEDDCMYDFEMYFGNLVGNENIYLGSTIPEKKLQAFSKNFEAIIINNSEFYVYFDDSIAGKGDNGFAIVKCDNQILFLFKTLEEGSFGAHLIDFIKVEYLEKFGIICTLRSSDDDQDTGFVYKSRSKAVTMALFNFMAGESEKDYEISDEEGNLILSMANLGSDEDDDNDNDPLGLRGNKTSTDNNDPLGLRN